MLINLVLANIGLPMVAVYLPFAWFALVPIIFVVRRLKSAGAIDFPDGPR